jgi:AraC family transcriptional regulator
MPKRVVHDNRSISTVYDTFALYPADATVAAALRVSRLPPREVRELETRATLMRRSQWLDELLERYFRMRVVSPGRRASGAAFFESEILGELFRLRFGERTMHGAHDRLARDGDVAQAALGYIESNLFSPLRLEDIARHAGASVATLLRHFRAAFHQTPYAYARRRRLDEARRLVEAGENSVTDIALIVGYDDVAAFSKAFRSRFGVAPSRRRALAR